MPTRAAAAALLGAGAGGEEEEEEEEEEEDEPLALPVPAASSSSSSSKRPAAAAGEGDEGMRQPDVKRARSGKVRSTDVCELQAALEEAEARIEGFQVRFEALHGTRLRLRTDGLVSLTLPYLANNLSIRRGRQNTCGGWRSRRRRAGSCGRPWRRWRPSTGGVACSGIVCVCSMIAGVSWVGRSMDQYICIDSNPSNA